MSKETLPYKRTPCKSCPLRKDSLKGWLGKERAEEISEQDSFVCHKSINYSKKAEEDKGRLQCAGHMILFEDDNIFVRTAKIFKQGINLKGQNLVFDSKEEFINHHNHGN